MRKFAFIALLCSIAALAFAARCHRLRDVFIDSKIYFLDPDCYSRMTRARMVSEGAALTIRHHDFENWPHGITAHTTAPLDWLIAALARVVPVEKESVLALQRLDLAGALIGPLLGVLACGAIALLLRRSPWSLAAAALFAVSPILVHGTSLGRPDHQALLIALFAGALALELRLLATAGEAPRRGERKLAGGSTPGPSIDSESTSDGVAEDAALPSGTPSGVHSSSTKDPGFHPGLRSGGPSGAQEEQAMKQENRKTEKNVGFLLSCFPASTPTALVCGVAWGLALWVSLYEPLVLLALTLLGLAIAKPAAFRERARRWQWGAIAIVFGAGVLIDGWRVSVPPPELRDAFARWKLTIAELNGANFTAILRWLGAACLLAPFALAWRWRKPEARWLLVLLVATFALTCWQLRWGYFLALVFALSLPTLVAAFPRYRGVAAAVLVLGLWPMAQEWEQALFADDPATERAAATQRMEAKALRAIAETMGEREAGAFLAPWWLSPSIAYWSRQPGVTGSSHESLPGTLDSARIYLAPNSEAALPLLRERRVAWIVGDLAERVVPASATLLGVPAPPRCLAHDLASRHWREPITPGLERETALPFDPHQFFQVWRVR